jgi:hypothetical protein
MSHSRLADKESNITHFELLCKLEPLLAKRYALALIDLKGGVPLSIKERFERVDGGFYEKTKTGHSTVTPSGAILKSQHIPLKKTTLEAIRSHEDLGPVQAQEELKRNH